MTASNNNGSGKRKGDDQENLGASGRKFQRKAVPLLVQYRFNVLEEFHTDYSVNISGGGLYLKMTKPATLGSTVYLQFIMRGGGRVIQCRGRVVRVDGSSGSSGGAVMPSAGSGAAVQFVDLDEDDLSAILKLIGKSN